MLKDQEKSGSGGGTRTPDTRIMIPPAERRHGEENQAYQALAGGDNRECAEHAGNAPVTKAGTVPQIRPRREDRAGISRTVGTAEERVMNRRKLMHETVPDAWRGPLSVASEIADLLATVRDEGADVECGASGEAAALWVTIDGVEYYITVALSQTQKIRDGALYMCETCSGGGEIAPNADCPDCDGIGACVRP